MAIEKKRMQQRYGTYQQFQNNINNLLPNEFASVTSGDILLNHYIYNNIKLNYYN